MLEVARAGAGRGVSVGPLRGRRAAVELLEQLNSLFGLRHCGRKLPLRQWPSAYGQMGRCLSPCLNDLDPNLYRRRLDEALALFTGRGDGGAALLAHVDRQMREAAAAQRYERAAWLRRRATASAAARAPRRRARRQPRAPRLVLAEHPRSGGRFDAFWLVGGRVVDWGRSATTTISARTASALRGGDGTGADRLAHARRGGRGADRRHLAGSQPRARPGPHAGTRARRARALRRRGRAPAAAA